MQTARISKNTLILLQYLRQLIDDPGINLQTVLMAVIEPLPQTPQLDVV